MSICFHFQEVHVPLFSKVTGRTMLTKHIRAETLPLSDRVADTHTHTHKPERVNYF